MAVIATGRFASARLRATRFDPAIELPLLVLQGSAPTLRERAMTGVLAWQPVVRRYVEGFPAGERYAGFRIVRQRFLDVVVPSQGDR